MTPFPRLVSLFPASYTDQGEYVRYATTTNQFIATKNYQLFQNIELDGSRLNLNKRNLISKISLISNLNLTLKFNCCMVFPDLYTIFQSDLITGSNQKSYLF